MSWYDRLSQTNQALLTANKWQYSNSKPLDNILSSWDVNSLDYNASGGQGWVNRLVGLTAPLNPLAWAGTAIGRANKELVDNTETNAFKKAWEVGTGTASGTGGGILSGFFQGTNSAEQVVKGGLLSLGAYGDVAANKIDVKEADKQIASAWDLSKTKDIGTAEAFVYDLGLPSQITSELYRNTFISDSKEREQAKKDLDKSLNDWGLGFQSSNFNIWNKDDQAQFEWGNKNSSWIANIVQPANLAATLVLDPVNLIPFGAVGKGVLTARRGISTATKYAEDVKAATATAEGQVGKNDQFFDFLAKNNADTIRQHKVFQDASGPQADLVAELMGRVNTKEDAAKVYLASNYGSARATAELAVKYGDEGNFRLLADRMNGGGYANRLHSNPAMASKLDEGVVSDPEMLKAMDTYMEQVGADPFVRQLRGAVFKEGTDEAGKAALVSTPTQAIKLAPGRGLEGKLEEAGAKFRNALTKGEGSESHWVTQLDKSLPVVVNVIRRGALTSSRGVINLENADGQAYDKFVGYIDDIDKVAKGSLTESGTRSELYSAFRSATNPTERYQAMIKAEQAGWNAIAARHGISTEDAQALQKNIRGKMNNYTGQLNSSGYATLTDGTVMHDPVFKGQSANTLQTVDFPRLNKYLSAQGKDRIDSALTNEGAMGKATPSSVLYDLQTGASDVLQAGNRIWSAGIITRPARVVRDIAANFATGIAGGHLGTLAKNQGFEKAFQAAVGAPKRAIDSMLVSSGRRESIDALEAKATQLEADADDILRQVEVTRDRVYSNATNSSTNLTPEQKVSLEQMRIANTGDDVYHTFVGGLPSNVDYSRGIVTSVSKDEAASYGEAAAIGINYDTGLAASLTDLKKMDEFDLINKIKQNSISERTGLIADVSKARVNNEVREKISSLQNEIDDARLQVAANPGSPLADKLTNNIADWQNEQTRLTAGLHAVPSEEVLNARGLVVGNSIADAESKLARFNSELAEDGMTIAEKQRVVNAARKQILKDIKSGKAVQLRLKDSPKAGWKAKTVDDIENLGNNLSRYEVRVLESGKTPSTKTLRVYGDTADISKSMPDSLKAALNLKDDKEVGEYLASRKWDKDSRLIGWADENGIGKVLVSDVNSPSGSSMIAVPKYIRTNGYDPVDGLARERVLNGKDNATLTGKVPEGLTPTQVQGKQVVDTLLGPEPTDLSAVPAYMDAARRRAANMKAEASSLRNSVSKRVGAKNSDGTIVIGDNVFAGAFDNLEGSYYKSATDADVSAKLLYGSPDLSGMGTVQYKQLKPTDSKYYEGWAGWLNYVARTDPSIAKIAAGATREDMIKYFKSDPAGKAYANEVGIGNKYTTAAGARSLNEGKVEGLSIEDYTDMIFDITNQHLGDDAVRRMFVDGTDFNADILKRTMAGREDSLVALDGRLVNPDARRGIVAGLSKSLDVATKYLAGAPQTHFFNHPLFKGVYNKRVNELAKISAPNGEGLSAAERNVIESQARKDALKETKKWIYNVDQKTNLEQAVGQFMPFLTAYTYTVRTLANSVKENPGIALWAYSMGTNTVGKWPWIDENGEPTHDLMKASALVLPLSDEIKDTMTKLPEFFGGGNEWKTAENIKISARSMNVLFGGEALPGPGPIITIPVSELAKSNPGVAEYIEDKTQVFPGGEGLVGYVLPFGVSQEPGSYSQLLPGWSNNLKENLLRSPKFVQTLSEITVYENAQYKLGYRDKPPTAKELEEKARSYYEMKAGIAFNSPASFSLETEYDLARDQYKQYQDTYGDEAGYRFITDNPDLYYAVTSSNKNEYGLSSTTKTVDNLEKYNNVANMVASSKDAGKDLMPFLMGVKDEDFANYDKTSDTWLKTHSPVDGTDTYLGVLTPDEMQAKVDSTQGWIMYKKAMGLLDAEAERRETPVGDDDELAYYKSQYVYKLKQEYPAWGEQYGQQNTAKYETRANLLEQVLNDPTWMSDNSNRADVKSIAAFLQVRDQVKDELSQRKAETGHGDLSAKDNADLADQYNQVIFQLKNDSLQFSDFYNEYFDGDTLAS